MGYPEQYPEAAIETAEKIVASAVETRLRKVGSKWKAPHFLLPNRELIQIRQRFWTQPLDEDLVRFIGLVFSKACPEIHYEFVSDGFELGLGGPREQQTIVVDELPPCSNPYDKQPEQYRAALNAVQALIYWRLSVTGSWIEFVDGDLSGSDLIDSTLYQMIKTVGDFTYCRTYNVIRFVYAAVPELRKEWEIAGLELSPRYSIKNRGSRRFTALRLTPK